jgi:hypothetical protein
VSFGARRLEDAITAGRAKPLAEVVGELREAIVKWRGSEVFNDDISLFALEKE